MRRYRFIAAALVLMLITSGLAFAQDQVTIRLAGWSGNPAEQATMDAMLKAFEEANPDIKVDFQVSTDHNTTMQTAFAAGDYAEVFFVNSDIFDTWADAGVLADGTDMITDQEDIIPSLRDAFTYEGKLYCAPKDYSTLALEYNKDMFDAAGVAYPTADWTWDDLKAAAEKLTGENTDGQKVLGLVLPADLNRWLPFFYQNGAKLFNDDGSYALNTQEATDAMNFFLDLVVAGNAGPASAVDTGWGGDSIGQGRAAMVMEGNWVIQYLLDSYPDLNWGVSELPKSPSGGEASMLYSVCYGVRGIDNPHPEESWRLANFLTGKEGQMMVATAGFGALPGRVSASEAWSENAAQNLTEAGRTDLAEQMSVFPTSATFGHAWRLPAGWNTYASTFNASLQEAYTGNKLAEDVLADASAVAEELIAKAK